MNVIGLDMSLTSSGVVVLNRKREVMFHCTITSKLRGMERLAHIRGEVGGILKVYRPSLVCIEHYYYGNNVKTLCGLAELGGVIRLMLHRNNFRYVDVEPSSLKKFVLGKGAGDKDQITKEVLKRWKWDAPNNDEADAYTLGRIALALTGHDVALTQAQQEALDVIQNGKPPAKRKAGRG